MKICDFIKAGGGGSGGKGKKKKEKDVSFTEKDWGKAGARGKSRGEEKVIEFPPNAKDGARLRVVGADKSM